jgi:hypothetical protein
MDRSLSLRPLCAIFLLVGLWFVPMSGRAQGLKIQKFPDGSGQIGVAPGWKLADSGSGAAVMSGPGGAVMQLGQFRFVFAHDFDRQTLTPGVNPEVPRVHLDDPVRATLDILAAMQRQGAVSQIKLKGVEPAQGFPGGRAAFLRYSARVQGKPLEIFGLYIIAPTDRQSGSYFYSFVAAPPTVFGKRLPEMKAMWKSWSLSPKLLSDRLEGAMKTLGEIDYGASDASTTERRRVAQRSARQFQDLINDVNPRRDRWGRREGDPGYDPTDGN